MTAAHAQPGTGVKLTSTQQLALTLAAGFDVGLRTAISSVLAAALAPTAVSRSRITEDVLGVQAYADLATTSLATLTQPATPAPTPRRVRTAPLPGRWRPGALELLAFPSGYAPVRDAARQAYDTKPRNHTAWAHHWRHDGDPRPTLIALHGFGASPVAFNRDFFSIPWFYGRGLNVMLVSLPFHGRRRSRAATLNGIELFSSGLSLLNEGLLQAIHDVRRWIDALLALGAPSIGVTGLSLGGYVSAAVAAADDRLAACVPNAPVVDIATLLPVWRPAGPLALRRLERQGCPPERLAAALSVHSPLRAPPLIPTERLMVIAGLGDRLSPPGQSRLLWEHWGRPSVHWFPGNHVIHLERRSYLRELAHFLDDRGLTMERP